MAKYGERVLVHDRNVSAIFSHVTDEEPRITEDVFFHCLRDYDFHFLIEHIITEELNINEILDESSFEIVASLYPPGRVINRLHYVMYRIGKKENGLQIFFQCLKETQDRAPSHGYTVYILEDEGQLQSSEL